MDAHSQTVSNYITGGTGGAGGGGYGNGTGGDGGHGIGPTLNFDISANNLTMNNLHGARGIDILHQTVALAAIHDSVESFPQPRCHPETRVQMLKELRKWALAGGQPNILWLYGPAGAGKSAIMQTLARQLQGIERLGGCFFSKEAILRAEMEKLFIRDVFDLPIYLGNYHPFNVEQSFHDVHKYFHDEFGRIHRKHRKVMANVPSPWPSPSVLETLVQNSSGYFIYASTIIKFIDDTNYRPTERLAIVEDGSKESPFDALDQLYMTILCSVARLSELIPILCAIANFRLSVGWIEQLFGLADGDAQLLLRGLHSVLNVPSNNKDVIHSHHASFLDFLNNPTRSRNFYIGGSRDVGSFRIDELCEET
ncbi:NACHT domain-containing protein [Mycena sanguinolenta]|uniref:NACHT domain-containing protein n=1 Tax=Mycena sanguinolenta TaxID=230812 RepID=A0A8H6ZA27_9AGAR|nr:NACHT domain-containing protein [Mycena sanguinolenta]